jgi:RNA polymerase sigma-70 factor (ECF subfamily)
MEQAIQRLRKEYRRCFILRYVEERSYDDNADILDLLVGTVKSYTHRAKKELKRMPSPLLDAPPTDAACTPA